VGPVGDGAGPGAGRRPRRSAVAGRSDGGIEASAGAAPGFAPGAPAVAGSPPGGGSAGRTRAPATAAVPVRVSSTAAAASAGRPPRRARTGRDGHDRSPGRSGAAPPGRPSPPVPGAGVADRPAGAGAGPVGTAPAGGVPPEVGRPGPAGGTGPGMRPSAPAGGTGPMMRPSAPAAPRLGGRRSAAFRASAQQGARRRSRPPSTGLRSGLATVRGAPRGGRPSGGRDGPGRRCCRAGPCRQPAPDPAAIGAEPRSCGCATGVVDNRGHPDELRSRDGVDSPCGSDLPSRLRVLAARVHRSPGPDAGSADGRSRSAGSGRRASTRAVSSTGARRTAA
jgi:hypothetical protein